MSPVRRRERLALAAFRVLLRLYPRRFQARFREDMQEALRDSLREAAAAGGAPASVWTWLRASSDVVRSALLERIHPAPPGPRPDPDPAPHSSRLSGGGGRGNDRIPLMETLLRDVRFALRSLGRRPGFAGVAVLTLALGIGANTAIFSVVNGVLLQPLPYAEPEGLVMVWAHSPDRPDARGVMSVPDIHDIAALGSFEALVGYSQSDVALTGLGEAELIPWTSVTDGFLATFRTAPVRGRDLRAEESVDGGPAVVVVSHAFWRGRLGGRPDAVGSTLELAGRPWEVVGVAPPGFDFPDGTQIWRPLHRSPDSEGCGRGCHTLRAVGRLASGVRLERARQELAALGEALAAEFPDTNLTKRFRTLALLDDVVGDVRAGLWMLLGAVGVVLVIACANVANLLLVRASSRRGEVAVRTALGASRGRLTIQVLAESLVLACAGGVVGLALAAAAVRGLRELSSTVVPRAEAVAVDGPVLLFVLLASAGVAAAFGLGPALYLARRPPREALGATGRAAGSGASDGRSRGLLLAGEVALSFLLLVSAGLLLRTFVQLQRVPLGFDGREVVRFTLSLPSARYEGLGAVAGFYRELEERLLAVPGVGSVGSAFHAPFSRGRATGDVLVEGRPEPAPGEGTSASISPATPGYLPTLRVPLLRGRGLEPGDADGQVPVAVVTETFVRENFPDEDPLGRQIRITVDFGYGSPLWTIVGVVGDVRTTSLTQDAASQVYVPHAQMGSGYMTVHVRGPSSAASLVPRVREAVRALDRDLPLARVETVPEALERQTAPARFYLLLVGGFAALAVVLAAVGLYGVVAYLVSRRTREIGIRMALGARRAEVVRLVLAQGIRPAAWGLALGLLGALAAGRVLESLLFGVGPGDPWVLAGVGALLLAVTAAACLLPARRATRIDPVEALRETG